MTKGRIYLVGIEYTVFRPHSVATNYETRAVCDSFEKALDIQEQLEKMKWNVLDVKVIIQEVFTNRCYANNMLSGSHETLEEK